MAEQITLEEALQLVEFEYVSDSWQVKHVKSGVEGDVEGDVVGDIAGDLWGDIKGNFYGTIKGRKWQLVETSQEKLRRLIEEGADRGELLEALDQLEDSSHD